MENFEIYHLMDILENSVDVLSFWSGAESFQGADQTSQNGFTVFFDWVDFVFAFTSQLDAHEIGAFV